MMYEYYEYKGCLNCEYQIDVFRGCEWLEDGGDGQVHIICPRWERRTILKDFKDMIYRRMLGEEKYD